LAQADCAKSVVAVASKLRYAPGTVNAYFEACSYSALRLSTALNVLCRDRVARSFIGCRVMEPTHSLEAFFPDRSSPEPLGRQLTRKMREAIERGELGGSTRLLPSRELALRLGLARNTVVAAIDQLIAEGFLEARIGAGTFVVPKTTWRKTATKTSLLVPPPSARRLSEFVTPPLVTVLEQPAPGYGYALRSGIPDVRAFPVNIWNRIARHHLSRLAAYLPYDNPSGYRPLREAIAQHLRQFRGVTSEAANVIIVEGTQAALALAATVLLTPGDRVLIEDPCYAAPRRLFAARGMQLQPSPIDEQGLDADGAPAARLAFVAPSHQYPLGGAMSIQRRDALLRWATHYDAYILEDDYDSEFYYATRPLPALQSLDRNERVVYIGTYSKTLAPGLRVGYLIVPPHLRKSFQIARALDSYGCATLDQAILADFVAQGHLARHIRRMTDIYAQRRDRLLKRLQHSLPAGFAIGPSQTGLHVALHAPAGFDDLAAKANAARAGLHLESLSKMCVARQDCAGFVLGYTSCDAEQVEAAAGRLIEQIAATS
jgi:GntR family transcriptional regulator/MocR family aminotransferase